MHLGLGGERTGPRVENLIAWVESLKQALDIPASIQAAGVPEADFLAKVDKIAVEAFDDQCTGANPRFPLISELKAILIDSYYGRPYIELTDRPEADADADEAPVAAPARAKAKAKAAE